MLSEQGLLYFGRFIRSFENFDELDREENRCRRPLTGDQMKHLLLGT